MRLFYFKTAICFVLAAAGFVPSGVAADYARFLSNPDFAVETGGDGKPAIFPGGHDEKYWAKDSAGNRYKLRLKNALPNYAEIGFSILSEAAGAPHLPVFPVLLRRGEQKVPTSEVAQAIAPENKFMGLAGSHGEWFSATLQPVTTLSTYDPKQINAKQASQLVSQLLLNFVAGNNDLQLGSGTDGNIGFTGKEFVTLDATQSFKFFSEEASANVGARRYLDLYPPSLLKSVRDLRPTDQAEFVSELNRVISRLEKVTPAEIELYFGAYFRGMTSFRQFKKMPPFDYAKELQRRIALLRTDTRSWLASASFPQDLVTTLKTPADVQKNRFEIPATRLTFDSMPKGAVQSPAELLWSYYFQDFWKLRLQAETAWASELGIPSGETISHLRGKAATGGQNSAEAPRLNLTEILAIADPKIRVAKLSSLKWTQLSPEHQALLLERAPRLNNSYEIGAVLQIAEGSRDARWWPVFTKWQEDWAPVERGWQTFTRTKLNAILSLWQQAGIGPNCLNSEVKKLLK